MGQRVMIAMMLIAGPDLLIADEPTSALDVTVQHQVLAIMDDLVRSRGMGLILISHNLHLVSVLLRPRAGDVCRPRGRDLRRLGACARRAIPTRAACWLRCPNWDGGARSCRSCSAIPPGRRADA